MTLLEHISTHWKSINEPARFVIRYAGPIRAYLCVLVGNEHDADEVAQEFLLRSLYKTFAEEQVTRGRFRDYLRAVVRNAAIDYLRRRRLPQSADGEIEQLADRDETSWTDQWRACVLDRAWEKLAEHQRQTPGNIQHTVLRLSVDHKGDDSPTLAARVSQATGRPLTAEAYRQQLSRARKKFAEFLVAEVSQTLRSPSQEEIRDELSELGLLPYVADVIDD